MTLSVIFLSICTLSGFAQCVSPGTSINFTNTGNNTSAGYNTVYVLTDNAGIILQEVSSGFSAPSTSGDYKVYAVNYDTGGSAPVLSAGTDISAIGGSCADYSSDPLLFCVAGQSNCLATGSAIAFSTTGQNTDPGFETMYVLTDSADVIISSANASPITAPSTAGTYKIYVVNYDTNNGNSTPTLTAGTPISGVGGDCVAISDSPLVVCVAPPMPVILVSFTAVEESGVAQLKWETTEESNSERFDIQRSADAKVWVNIGTKGAAGESKALQTYNFSDISPLKGANYYRLKMIDQDATFSYSRIEGIRFKKGVISVYPNPVENVLFLTGIEWSDVKLISIHNSSGQTVYARSSFSSSGINVSRLATGIYLVRITETDGTVHTSKVVILK